MVEQEKAARRDGGLRERKRQETLARITAAGLALFKANGFDATTLDAIAEAAGISRRTFFHYFKSKDDILLSQTGMGETLSAALANRHPEATPLAAVRQAMVAILATYAPDELIALDQMMLSSQAVQTRKQATYLQDEKTLYDALCRYFPQQEPVALRLIAMLSVGILRTAMQSWRHDRAKRPLAEHVEQGFNILETAFAVDASAQ